MTNRRLIFISLQTAADHTNFLGTVYHIFTRNRSKRCMQLDLATRTTLPLW